MNSRHKSKEKKMKAKTKQDQKKFWVRVICVFLAFLMVASVLFSIFGLF